MKTTFQINGRYISRMAAEQKAGAERLRRMIDESRESYLEDPEEEISFMVSGGYLLSISISEDDDHDIFHELVLCLLDQQNLSDCCKVSRKIHEAYAGGEISDEEYDTLERMKERIED